LSWFSNLAETYDRLGNIVGEPDDKGNILLPSNHMAANTDVCVIIDGGGNFRRADESKENIIIPCTEDSASRANNPSPHPLHEQVDFLSLDDKKRAQYLSQLSKWALYNNKVRSVYEYLLGNTLVDDLGKSGVKTDNEKLGKLFVRFSVEASTDDLTPQLWKDKSVVEAWQDFCSQNQAEDEGLCYVTGTLDNIRIKHPKGINPIVNHAKLISCNDSTNYTYRGRFIESGQANAIGGTASHKAHAMLRYLIATQGYKCDSQAVAAWAVDDGEKAVSPFTDTLGIYGNGDNDLIEARGNLDDKYAKSLRDALSSKGNAGNLTRHKRTIAVIAVDAATTGRMAVTFYKELREDEYIEKITDWHESCCWLFRSKSVYYPSAPGDDKIMAAIYGDIKGENYGKFKKQLRERLLNCILNGERINRAWLSAATQHASSPFSYMKQDGSWDIYKWEAMVNTACAIARKIYMENGEVYALELENTRTDRDYLFGRLLAVADQIESHARYLQMGKNDTDKRPTNAVRYMSAFAAKPFRTWELIYRQLSPYIQRLNGGEWYQRQIDDIMSLFTGNEFESDKSLNGNYLMGYSLQRKALKSNNDAEENDDVE